MVLVALVMGSVFGAAVGAAVASRHARVAVQTTVTAVTGLVERERIVDGLRRLERAAQESVRDSQMRREAAALAHQTLDLLPLGIVIIGPDGHQVLVNRVARQMGGSRHTDALVIEAIQTLGATALDHRPSPRMLELVGPPRRTVVISAGPITLPQNDEPGALVVVEDVTEQQHLTEVRTDFVANVSHELKTPVGAIALLAETMADENDPAIVRRLSERIVAEAHRVGGIIGDLLELSRIEIGGAGHKSKTNVSRVVNESVERVRWMAESRHITIERVDPSSRLALNADRRQLVSAVGNLLENAVKYSDPGGLVTVTVRHTDTGIEFVVSDRGIGIPARDLDRIFERFYRVDRGRSRETGGNGLGLSIVRHVAQNHGGTITVQSIEGEGSVFTLRIPTAVTAVAADEMAEAG